MSNSAGPIPRRCGRSTTQCTGSRPGAIDCYVPERGGLGRVTDNGICAAGPRDIAMHREQYDRLVAELQENGYDTEMLYSAATWATSRARSHFLPTRAANASGTRHTLAAAWGDLVEYMKLVIARRITSAISALALILAIYNGLRPPSRPAVLAIWLWIAVAVGSLIVAQFLAWRDSRALPISPQHEERLRVIAKR